MGKPIRLGFAAVRRTACVLALGTLVAPAARSETETTTALEFRSELKRLEYLVLHEGARREMDERRRDRERPVRRVRRATRSPHAPGVRQRPARDALEPGGPQGTRAAGRARLQARSDAPLNHRMNDRAGDVLPASTQSEVSIAALGDQMVSAWNDAEAAQSGSIGYGWSTDGGATWHDGGGLPVGAEVRRWVSDPVVTVDERSGEFYVAAMAITPGARSAIGVVRGGFQDGVFAWSPPVVARVVRDTLPDKPWIVADSTSGNLYLTYTAFFRIGGVQVDQIEFQRSRDHNLGWDLPRTLSSRRDFGLVQGSRPAVGPAGELYVTWLAVDTTLASGGLDWIRFRASTDRGASFATEESVTGFYTNFASGAPGFNRGYGLAFPGIAVDRSAGPYRGRAYVTWNEGVDFFHDAPGDSNPRPEGEPNDLPGVATAFNLGETLRGAISPGNDVDTFRFLGARGQTVTFYIDSIAAGLDASMRLLCSDGETMLAYSAPGTQGRVRVLVFTPPRSDQFYLRLTPVGSARGGYRVRTGAVSHSHGRARDQRDVFVAARDPHGSWGAPTRVNDDPPWFDGWLPEVAVAADGRLYAAWYDWRDRPGSTCGGWSNVYLARSLDGGASWASVGTMSDQQTDWTNVASLIAPNHGDYIGLFAGVEHVTIAWSDGREGDPDVMMARYALDLDPPLPGRPVLAIARLSPNPARGAFDVELALRGVGSATLELIDLGGRRLQSLPVGALGAGTHVVRFEPGRHIRPGFYWLRVVEAGRTASRKVALLP